ncbi:hypothetical protein CYMTET_55233 [Cymbomonas tetramitiformis]|uniref:Uncharacterized protein n=1 Tax=Cymbomonas tetramitiformis TaxID=36881 RepID=A0AAE0EN49_9CHLO|nr:hypothetical protein CYMTET_55233 [Cymbomonas tetramitiformis]
MSVAVSSQPTNAEEPLNTGTPLDGLPDDVLRLILDREGMNSRGARDFISRIKNDCDCRYEPETRQFVADGNVEEVSERDALCLSGNESLLWETFCEQLTGVWAEARGAMEMAMVTVDTPAEKVAAILANDLKTPDDGPAKTRLLGVAFRSYLRECLNLRLFHPNSLWHKLLAAEEIRRMLLLETLDGKIDNLKWHTTFEFLCDEYPEASLWCFVVWYSHVLKHDVFNTAVSRISKALETTNMSLSNLDFISRIISTDDDRFHVAFDAYLKNKLPTPLHERGLHGPIDIEDVEKICEILENDISRRNLVLDLYLDNKRKELTPPITGRDVKQICELFGNESSQCEAVFDLYVDTQRKELGSSIDIFDDVTDICKQF